jgi:hypothetical protein
MDLHSPSDGLPSGGFSSRLSGLLVALFHHLFSLGELAAEEARIFIRQSVASLILLASLILVIMISYLGLIATVVSLLTLGHGWNWAAAFGVITLFHLLLAGVLLLALRLRITPRPFEATAVELRRDLDHLKCYSKKSSSQRSTSHSP